MVMEHQLNHLESLWESISEFKNRFGRSEIIPQTLENYLISVTRTGNILLPWDHVKCLFRCKLVLAVREFGDEKVIEDEVMILSRFDNFRGAPFTIQRLAELILEPKRHYTSKLKYLRALEKCVRVTSTVEGMPFESHLEVKEEIDEDEFGNEGEDEEELLNDDSWITDNDSSYVEEEDLLGSPDVKINLVQQMKEEVEDVGNKLDGRNWDKHRLPPPNIESKKIIDHPALLKKPRSMMVKQTPTNLTTSTNSTSNKCPFCPLTLRTQLVLKWHIDDKHPHEEKPKQDLKCIAKSCNNFFCCGGSSGDLLWKHSREKIYNCQICLKTFGTDLGLKWHMESHTRNMKPVKKPSDDSNQKVLYKKSEDRKFGCSYCPKSFKAPSLLKIHERIHTGEKPFGCSECRKAFSDKSNLINHMKIHTGEKPFGCSICKKAFTQQNHLVDHLRIHTGEKPFKCSICIKAFTQQHHLVNHLRIHTGEKPFGCSECRKAFSDKRNLIKHMKIHTGEKPFGCSICKKAFTQQITLDIHLRTHTGEKPFGCSICEKTFTQQQNLDVHLRTHTGEKPFVCSVCGKRFARSWTLKYHSKTHITRVKPYGCSICHKRFSSSSHLQKHTKTHK